MLHRVNRPPRKEWEGPTAKCEICDKEYKKRRPNQKACGPECQMRSKWRKQAAARIPKHLHKKRKAPPGAER